MDRYRVGCRLSYEVETAMTFIFNIEIAHLIRHLDLKEELSVNPGSKQQAYTVPDIRNRYFSVNAEPGPLELDYRAEVAVDVFRANPLEIFETPLPEIPLDILPYLLPSRFVPSDRLAAFAYREFGSLEPGHTRVTGICNWLYENIDYRRGSSSAITTASESLIARAGVCRDFAHLGISFCRALNIPARLVSCYAYGLEPSDFHAVFEAYLSGRWWLFDGTRQAHLDGLVRIGVGRDAAEIAFSSAFGAIKEGAVTITMQRVDGRRDPLYISTDAISTEEPAPNAGAA
jgi:transglutaminase-like putative cysteine protease